MNKLDLIAMSFKNLAKRKIRTCLTILSVIIGATSIIVMVSLGVALDEKFNEEIASLGNITTIRLNGYDDKIEKADIEKIQKISNISAVSPTISMYDLKLVFDDKYVGSFEVVGLDAASMKEFGYEVEEGRLLDESDKNKYHIVFGSNTIYKYVGSFEVVGLDAASMKEFGYEVEEGRLLDESDKNKYHIVFGSNTIYNFLKKGKAFPWYQYVDSPEDIEKAYKADVLNGRLKIYTDQNFGLKKEYQSENGNNANHKTFSANAVGILKQSDSWELKHQIFMSFEAVEKIQKEIAKAIGNTQKPQANQKKGYKNVLVKVDSFENVESAISEIKKVFEQNKKQIGVYSEAEYIQSSKRLTSMVQAFLGAIGSISLFIAAIGITNTMIMSIYERTKEIGIMKVIGARVSDVKRIFLLEATLIGFIGGFVGVLFSYFISYILNKFGVLLVGNILGGGIGNTVPKISSIPLWLASLSLLFTSLIGLIAGYLPARKVVKIEALKAIKSE